MGRRGKQPTPTHILKGRGSREAYNRKGEPGDLPGSPSCHALLEGDAEATEEWLRMHDRLSRLRVWNEQYERTLATYCLLWSKFVANEMADPEHRMKFNEWDKLLNQLMKFWREFGCTPASKTTLRVNEGESQPSDPKGKYGVVG